MTIWLVTLTFAVIYLFIRTSRMKVATSQLASQTSQQDPKPTIGEMFKSMIGRF